MLYAFGFERIGVLASDLYFVDPDPGPGQEGPEQGVRVEVRLLEPGALHGSIYSARPIEVERAIWRADLLESVDHPGTLDRAHHHPRFRGWEPGTRQFVKEMTANPPDWMQEWSRQTGAELRDGLRENPGWIAFARADGAVYHTYTVTAPDPFVAPYFGFLLDRTPKPQPPEPRGWRKDEYPD